MSGIYIHIPFCKQACTYCNFHFSTQLKHKADIVNAILGEIDLKESGWNEQYFESIYFGGGTPSLLETNELEAILHHLNHKFRIAPNAEITLEANPDDINSISVMEWKSLGINRLSIGIQSLSEAELKFMNRSHTASQSLMAINTAINSGITNISIDLIFGSHLKNHEQWKSELEWAFNSGASHLSAYGLTVEDKTKLAHDVATKNIPDVSDTHQSEQFEILSKMANKSGWDFYEISNLCKPGHRALHNSNYWENKPYLGLGPSAHSYLHPVRSWNVANNAEYINKIGSGTLSQTSETLTPKDMVNELILTRLRRIEGLDISHIEANFPDWQKSHAININKFKKNGWLTVQNNFIILSTEGRLMADHISSEFMIE
jgi:oxygen-independent coproporphyrinogen III oxidase